MSLYYDSYISYRKKKASGLLSVESDKLAVVGSDIEIPEIDETTKKDGMSFFVAYVIMTEPTLYLCALYVILFSWA